MDGLRIEEVNRQRSAIHKHFGLSKKTNRIAVPENVQKKLKLYDRAQNHTLLDKIFSGNLCLNIEKRIRIFFKAN